MKLRRSTKIMFFLCLVMLAVNGLARLCHPAVDWYIAHIFPYLSGFWCRISGIFPFSIGEWMIVAGIVLAVLVIVSFPLCMIFGKGKRGKIACFYGRCCGWVLTYVFCAATMHFFVLYQGTQKSRTLGDCTYENAEVLHVYADLVAQANVAGEQVARDADGYFTLTDDLMNEAKACMGRLAESEPQYAGYYPDAKPIYHSYFFSQQGLLGIYYPHSMEANYNPDAYPVNLPVTVCHEYTHLKGNIFEDEAGYYAFLACMTSESADFRYSALICALEWMELDFGDDAAALAEYKAISATMSDGVRQDMYTFVPADYWETNQEKEVIPTDVVSKTADKVMDTSLKVNGVPDGVHSYHGMTALLLHYFLNEQ